MGHDDRLSEMKAPNPHLNAYDVEIEGEKFPEVVPVFIEVR